MTEPEIVVASLSGFDASQFYAYPQAQTWWRTNFVATLDGAAWSSDGTSGELGSAADKRAFSTMRSLADVVVVGAGTARDEGYSPTTADSVDGGLRARFGLAAAPTLTVVSRSLNVPASLVAGGAVVITTTTADPKRLAELRAATEVITHGTDTIDWAGVKREFADRGWHRILCEGGPSLHGDVLGAGIVNEVCLTIAPIVAAGEAGRIAISAQSLDQPAALDGVAAVDGALLTRWRPGMSSGSQ